MRIQEETLELYQIYRDMIYRICMIHLKNPQDACDATQETFLRLMQSDKEFENKEHAKAWLILVAGNCCKNMLKSFWRRNRSSEEKLDIIRDSAYEKGLPDNEVLEAIMNLPEKYKDLIYLHYYEGYSVEEIAALMKKNPSTLRSRLGRAREILKKYLEEGESYE